MKSKLVSVVVPAYNYAKYIEENINSVVSQSYSNLEMIIVDDCSTDDSEKIISKYVSDKVKYIRLPKNEGYGNAKNVGIRASQGEYIVVLDADDILLPGSVEVRVRCLEEHNADWVHARAYEFSGGPPYQFVRKKRKAVRRLADILKTKKYDDLWENIHAQTVMVRRSVYEKVGLYEPELRSMGDKEMWYRIIKNVSIPMFLNKFIVGYRQHRDQMHRSAKKKKHLKTYLRILGKCQKMRGKQDLSTVVRL